MRMELDIPRAVVRRGVRAAFGPVSRVALISLHTSPLDQPGTGDAGGMNVYVSSVSRRLAADGTLVDVYTRCRGDGAPEVERLASGLQLFRVQAGPCAPMEKGSLPEVVDHFVQTMIDRAARQYPAEARPYDVVHSHYWLSGQAGLRAADIWGAPLVHTFHTLGAVKNGSLAGGSTPEPPIRLAGERSLARAADRILVPTDTEADELISLYGACAGRISVIPPGVDRTLFRPRPKTEVRAELGFGPEPLLLFVGRLQPLKGPDVAIRTLAEASRRDPAVAGRAILAIVGGPTTASDGTLASLEALARELGVAERVRFFPPQIHVELARFYAAADVVLVPSRSESFGLAALEAQACGTPVVAAGVGGLREVVRDERTGLLVTGHDPADHAEAVLRLLRDPAFAARLSANAVRHAGRFSWDVTAADIASVYREVALRRAG